MNKQDKNLVSFTFLSHFWESFVVQVRTWYLQSTYSQLHPKVIEGKNNLNLKPSVSVCDHWFFFHVLNGQAKNMLFCFWVQALFLTELSVLKQQEWGITIFMIYKCFYKLFSCIFWSTEHLKGLYNGCAKIQLHCSWSLNSGTNDI